ncbi:MAG: anaerobic ribonucleoside-triphosphate reductase activating protein [Candidatus Fimivivens sp.]
MSASELTGSIRLAGIVRESIVDGPGIRLTVFTQGCPHNCQGCHNTDTHDPLGGYDCTLQKILDAFDADPLLRGVTLSGGEPFEQAVNLLPLAQAVRRRGKDVVAFSGYTFEELLERGDKEPAVIELLSLCCLLVDGRFVQAQRDLSLRFRGSCNQRLIDPQRSLQSGNVVLSEL